MMKSYLKSDEEIVSVFNDGMLKVFTKIMTYKADGDFEAWVYRIIRNTLLNHLRSGNQSIDIIELKDDMISKPPSILEKLFYEDLLDTLDALPDQARKIFKMYVIEGFTHKEISANLGISIGTSKWYLFKAKEKLNEILAHNRIMYG